ncbi:hypothetical protein NC796_23135 [Aliifodinibius sp. S!AR15-10]|uniref:hypothetical protein n=1 Tax=Aliifodinibius sp. S!AR15-10 TaxID=2950437 RepID=UPI00285B6E91|nr:hypothetical protein [Aliifodinibius sp. S!AR15-10]MDR8394067.1 hypothetical protein [Aliifodinibius sp. S!AR15-10]
MNDEKRTKNVAGGVNYRCVRSGYALFPQRNLRQAGCWNAELLMFNEELRGDYFQPTWLSQRLDFFIANDEKSEEFLSDEGLAENITSAHRSISPEELNSS